MKSKLEKLGRDIGSSGLDAIVLTDPLVFWHLSGHPDVEAYVLTSEGAATLIAPTGMSEQVRATKSIGRLKEYTPYPFSATRSYDCKQLTMAIVDAILDACGKDNAIVGLDEEGISFHLVNQLKRGNKSVKFEPAHEAIAKSFSVATPEDVDALKDLGRKTDEIIDASLEKARDGVSEKVVWLEIFRQMIERGIERYWHVPVVQSGPRSWLTWYYPSATERNIRTGDLVTIDLEIVMDGYTADVTRTKVVGGSPTEKQRRLHDTVEKSYLSGVAALSAAVSAKDVDRAARHLVDQTEFAGRFNHETGHGIGLPYGPLITPISSDLIQEGHVVTIEPGIYVEGLGGVRIESNFIVTKNGAVPLNRSDVSLRR